MLLVLFVGVTAPCYAFAQTVKVAKSDGVTIAIANEPPYALMGEDGSPTGAGPELDKAILREAGITKFAGAVMEYGAMIPAVQSKRASFASTGSLLITPERCSAVNFSEPLICDGDALIVANSLAGKVQGIKDLAAAGVRVGVCGGCTAQKKALAAGVPEDKIVIFPDATSGVKLLADGRIDVFLYGTIGTTDLYGRLVDKTKFKYVDAIDTTPGCQGAAFNKNDTELRDAYNAGIVKIRASGEYLSILRRFKMEGAAIGSDKVSTAQLCSK